MTNQLSEAEYTLLCEALDDGFPDMLGKKNPKNRENKGRIFSTNPLGQEVTYFTSNENAPSSFDQEMRQGVLSSDGGIYSEVDTSREYFAINPFGFNLSKLKIFFEEILAKYSPILRQEYNKYYASAEPYPIEMIRDEPGFPDVFGGVYSYDQWLENVLTPYSKIWFEFLIVELIKKAEHQVEKNEPQTAEEKGMRDWRLDKQMSVHFILGRMVEHYRWKFKYEASIVRRNSQFERAGTGGGKSSSTKRIERLAAFMEKIEELAQLTGLMDEERILAQAWDNVSKQRYDMPKTPKIRFEYEVEIRSTEPFKTRYRMVFQKNA